MIEQLILSTRTISLTSVSQNCSFIIRMFDKYPFDGWILPDLNDSVLLMLESWSIDYRNREFPFAEKLVSIRRTNLFELERKIRILKKYFVINSNKKNVFEYLQIIKANRCFVNVLTISLVIISTSLSHAKQSSNKI